ncbi:D-alanyl-D-alanine carboxypeptidase [Candidatus Aerophobetes bacterium]|nr:D-alanyl-D-alanine carboxypeptidase [Candidatus Aerophobetes bacterium]
MFPGGGYGRPKGNHNNILKIVFFDAIVGWSVALFFLSTWTAECYGAVGVRFSTVTGSAQTVAQETRGDNEVRVAAKSAIVVDFDTGNVLWEKNPDKLTYPASTTKIMTAIVAIENIKNPSKKVRISKKAWGTRYSPFTLKEGDKVRLEDLLKAALISSHNGAAVALAESVSGSVDDFVEFMNEKAKEIGAENTYFENPTGFDYTYPKHKSTARDLALITIYCLKNDLFREIVGTSKDSIVVNGRKLSISNTNKLLRYDYVRGVKTGYTRNARHCLVLFSDRGGKRLITVILASTKDGVKSDALRLIDWVGTRSSTVSPA